MGGHLSDFEQWLDGDGDDNPRTVQHRGLGFEYDENDCDQSKPDELEIKI